MFWVLFVRKYSKLTKFIQKIDPNSRIPRIFMDSVDKSAFYIPYVFSHNFLLGIGTGTAYFTRVHFICQNEQSKIILSQRSKILFVNMFIECRRQGGGGPYGPMMHDKFRNAF